MKVIQKFKSPDSLKAKKLINLANNAMAIDPEFASELIAKAIDLSKSIEYDRGMVYALRQKGLLYYVTSDNLNALKEFQNALKQSYTNSDLEFKGTVYNNIANIYADLGQYDIALENYEEFYGIAKKIGHHESQAFALGNMATINLELGKIDISIEELKMALEMSKHIDNNYLLGSIYNNLAIAYKNNGNYSLSEKYYNKAIDCSKKNKNKYLQATATNGLAKVALETKNYKNAILYAEQSLELSTEINALEWQSDSWELISKAYEALANNEMSLKAYKNHIKLKDSIYGKEVIAEVIREKAEYEKEKQEEKTKIKQDKQKLITNSIIIGSSSLTITALILFYFYKKHQNTLARATEKDFKTKVSELELKVLNAQVNPHFLYNALTSIGKYILENDSKSANDYLTKYASLVRLTLESSKKELINLENEIALLKMYIDIEKKRLKNKFSYQISVSQEIDSEITLIPPLTLQPFIENSIIHGISPLGSGGNLSIRFSQFNNNLLSIVDDNGIGRTASKNKNTLGKESLGIDITRTRINLIANNQKINIKIIDKKKGTRVEVLLPLEIED